MICPYNICPYNTGIEDEAIESSCGHQHSEVAFQHDCFECNSCQSKWDEKKNADIGTLHALRYSKSQTKTSLADSTQDSTMIECTLLVPFIQADVIVLGIVVFKRTVCVDYHFIRIVFDPN